MWTYIYIYIYMERERERDVWALHSVTSRYASLHCVASRCLLFITCSTCMTSVMGATKINTALRSIPSHGVTSCYGAHCCINYVALAK